MEKHWYKAHARYSATFSTASGTSDLDDAFKYLQVAGAGAIYNGDDVVNINRLRRKIDWHILPILFCCAFMQFLNKAVLDYATDLGLQNDLRLMGSNLQNTETALAGACTAATIITAIALQRLPPAKWLAGSILVCGLACGATAGAHDYTTLLIARIFLGLSEASILPCLIILTSQWYRKQEQTMRFSIWYCGYGATQILGGLTSFGLQHVQPRSVILASWRIMFLAVGGATIVVGLVVLVFLPDTPMKARFLSERETVVLLEHVSINRTGIKNDQFHAHHIAEALKDLQIWLLVLVTVSISTSFAIATRFSNRQTKNLGFSATTTTILLNLPPGTIAILTTLSTGLLIRHRILPRTLTLILCIIPALIGTCLLSQNHNPILAATYLIQTLTPTFPILIALTAANIAGSTKRIFGICLISACLYVGDIIAPNIPMTSDGKLSGKITAVVLASQAVAIVAVGVLGAWYYWRNSTKLGHRAGGDGQRWENETDGRNLRFRYVY